MRRKRSDATKNETSISSSRVTRKTTEDQEGISGEGGRVSLSKLGEEGGEKGRERVEIEIKKI